MTGPIRLAVRRPSRSLLEPPTVVELDEGSALLIVGGEPVLACPTLEGILARLGLRASDLEPIG